MRYLLALLPILLFVVLLTGLRQSAAVAGICAAALAVVLAGAVFDYPMTATMLLGPLAEAVFTSATILWIIFPALGIYEFQKRTGATEAIGSWLTAISPKPQMQALLIAFFFGLFLEGAAGFGTPVALVAPMLAALGFPPLKALLMALFGHAAGVSFGAVGTPVVPLLDAAPVDAAALSLIMILLHFALSGLLAGCVFVLARPADSAQAAPPWPVAAAALCFFVPAAMLALFTGPELPTLGGALIGALLFVTLLKRIQSDAAEGGTQSLQTLAKAALPYLLVLAFILATRLVTPLQTVLQAAALGWRIDERFTGAVAPLYHPGTLLMLALLVSAWMVRHERRGTVGIALKSAAKRLPPVALALVAVLSLARVMVHSGMIDALAQGASELLGGNWLLAAPLVGALGSFITGSATASNIILADFQIAAAAATGIAATIPLAGQGFGSAIGNIIAPHNILAGGATVGLVGREGEVLRKTLPICLLYAFAGGALLLVIAQVL